MQPLPALRKLFQALIIHYQTFYNCGSLRRRFSAFLGSAAVYFAVATMNAWPNLDAALQGDHKAAAMAFVQYTFAFIVAISPVASAHEKGGQAAVLVFMLAVLPGKAKTIPR
ncbi:MAG: hypothetical protein WCC41_13860 [Rhodomicrobium sp.]